MKMSNWKKSLSLLVAVACFGAIQARAQTLEIYCAVSSGSCPPLRVDRDVDFFGASRKGLYQHHLARRIVKFVAAVSLRQQFDESHFA